jgi:hypothetical protein
MATKDKINPFQMVYDELWSMLEEDVRFDVKEGNKLKFNNNDRSPMKTNMSTVDYPEVALFAENITGNLCNTSSTSMIRRHFSWIISSGDFNYSEIFPVEWAIFTGMLAWRYRISVLTWEGLKFVSQANIVESNFNQVDAARRRGIEGWIAVWSIFVEMHFSSDALQGAHLDP